jgi:hypothetical protein
LALVSSPQSSLQINGPSAPLQPQFSPICNQHFVTKAKYSYILLLYSAGSRSLLCCNLCYMCRSLNWEMILAIYLLIWEYPHTPLLA